jgi:hypothetical protein
LGIAKLHDVIVAAIAGEVERGDSAGREDHLAAFMRLAFIAGVTKRLLHFGRVFAGVEWRRLGRVPGNAPPAASAAISNRVVRIIMAIGLRGGGKVRSAPAGLRLATRSDARRCGSNFF